MKSVVPKYGEVLTPKDIYSLFLKIPINVVLLVEKGKLKGIIAKDKVTKIELERIKDSKELVERYMEKMDLKYIEEILKGAPNINLETIPVLDLSLRFLGTITIEELPFIASPQHSLSFLKNEVLKILEQFPLALFITTKYNVIIFLNDMSTKLFGDVPKEKFLGENLMEILSAFPIRYIRDHPLITLSDSIYLIEITPIKINSVNLKLYTFIPIIDTKEVNKNEEKV